jgi:hypothetical protein
VAVHVTFVYSIGKFKIKNERSLIIEAISRMNFISGSATPDFVFGLYCPAESLGEEN